MKKKQFVRDFDYYIDEYMYNCRSRKLRFKMMQSYEQTLRLFERWCVDVANITVPDQVLDSTIRHYICSLQERGKYTFYAVENCARAAYRRPLAFRDDLPIDQHDGYHVETKTDSPPPYQNRCSKFTLQKTNRQQIFVCWRFVYMGDLSRNGYGEASSVGIALFRFDGNSDVGGSVRLCGDGAAAVGTGSYSRHI